MKFKTSSLSNVKFIAPECCVSVEELEAPLQTGECHYGESVS